MKNTIKFGILLFISVWIFSFNSEAAIRYVSPSGSSAWSGQTVYNDVTSAITAASSGDEIWIAEGEYLIGSGGINYNVAKNLRFYGSFAGVETSISERAKVVDGEEWEFQNPTVLKMTAGSTCVWVDNSTITATFDGITFDGDNISGTRGIGVNAATLVTISRCIIKNNNIGAAAGGGITTSKTTIIEYSFITANRSNRGGGIAITGGSNSKILYSKIDNNTSTADGGGIDARTASNTEVANCIIENNQCTGSGGGAYFDKGTIHDCIIRNNKNVKREDGNLAGGGGGLMMAMDGLVTGYNLLIDGNQSGYGGGVFIRSNSNGSTLKHVLYNSIIINNIAFSGTGIGFRYDYNNTASSEGDRVYNCIVANNQYGIAFGNEAVTPNVKHSLGAGVYFPNTSDRTKYSSSAHQGFMANCILYNNIGKSSAVVNVEVAHPTYSPVFKNNILDNASITNLTQTSCIVETDPARLFTNIASNDFTPPATDFSGLEMGDATGLTFAENKDYAGVARLQGPAIEIGAYELIPEYQIVTLTIGAGIASTTPETITETPTGDPLTISFTLTSGYHSPYVSVNSIWFECTEEEGIYSFTIPAVEATQNIVISAFAENEIPVSEDTWTNHQASSTNFNQETYLNVRNTLSDYSNRRTYLRFNIPSSIRENYAKAELKLYINAASDRVNNNVSVRTVTSTITGFSDFTTLTWANSGAKANAFDGTEIAILSPIVGTSTAVNTELAVNLTDYIFNTAASDDVINLQIATNTDGYIHLKSLENGNANYVPVLIFSEPNVTFSDEETVVSTNTSYGNITVAAGKKLTVNTGVTLTGAKLILKSDENGTATFVNNGTAAFVTADVEQYLSTADGREWYYLASPVTTDHSNTVFGESALVGVYKENLHKYTNPVADTALVAGAGYVVKLSTSNPTYTFSGVLNDGNISVPVSRTGTTAAKRGFNLVGNPYPSYLDWDDVDKTNVMSTIWTRTFEGSAMVFKTYNADAQVGSDDETTARIAPLQAFWVKVPADKADIEGLTLDFNNSLRWHKTNDDAPLRAPTMVSGNAVEKNVGTQQLLRLQVSNGVNNDNAVIVFDNRASDLFDAFDSEKVTNNSDQIPEIYSLADGAVNPLVINCFKGMANSREFKLGFSTLVDGSFTIAALTRKNIENLSVVLVDKLLGLQHNLATAYTFVSNAVNTTERFSVRFQSEQTTVEMSENAPVASAYCNTNRRIVIALNNNAATGIKAQIYNVAGQLLSEQHLNANITRSEQSFEPGIYFVKIKSQKIKVIVN